MDGENEWLCTKDVYFLFKLARIMSSENNAFVSRLDVNIATCSEHS